MHLRTLLPPSPLYSSPPPDTRSILLPSTNHRCCHCLHRLFGFDCRNSAIQPILFHRGTPELSCLRQAAAPRVGVAMYCDNQMCGAIKWIRTGSSQSAIQCLSPSSCTYVRLRPRLVSSYRFTHPAVFSTVVKPLFGPQGSGIPMLQSAPLLICFKFARSSVFSRFVVAAVVVSFVVVVYNKILIVADAEASRNK